MDTYLRHTQTSHQTALLFPNNRSVAISIKNSQKIIALWSSTFPCLLWDDADIIATFMTAWLHYIALIDARVYEKARYIYIWGTASKSYGIDIYGDFWFFLKYYCKYWRVTKFTFKKIYGVWDSSFIITRSKRKPANAWQFAADECLKWCPPWMRKQQLFRHHELTALFER